ncbi:hypothetical protein F4778DRAFT_250864 [Xylariomycetidae sp. FL2044]|nr:hypothetical protein F4778DRAFT_250864 [Xylariomycetidae sp. FL2044]
MYVSISHLLLLCPYTSILLQEVYASQKPSVSSLVEILIGMLVGRSTCADTNPGDWSQVGEKPHLFPMEQLPVSPAHLSTDPVMPGPKFPDHST